MSEALRRERRRGGQAGAPPRGNPLPRAGRRGAGDGHTLEQLREAALAQLPDLRAAGVAALGLLDDEPAGARPGRAQEQSDPAEPRAPAPGRRVEHPEVVARTLPERPRAGRLVQSAGVVVHVELDPALEERGVILCSLEDAFREHPELVAPWYSKRLTIDRHKLEAANAAFWTRRCLPARPRRRGRRGPVRDRVRDRGAGRGAVRAHARAWAGQAASSA